MELSTPMGQIECTSEEALSAITGFLDGFMGKHGEGGLGATGVHRVGYNAFGFTIDGEQFQVTVTEQ
jgi:hypothetical protein